jgi:hypothetical protein
MGKHFLSIWDEAGSDYLTRIFGANAGLEHATLPAFPISGESSMTYTEQIYRVLRIKFSP